MKKERFGRGISRENMIKVFQSPRFRKFGAENVVNALKNGDVDDVCDALAELKKRLYAVGEWGDAQVVNGIAIHIYISQDPPSAKREKELELERWQMEEDIEVARKKLCG